MSDTDEEYTMKRPTKQSKGSEAAAEGSKEGPKETTVSQQRAAGASLRRRAAQQQVTSDAPKTATPSARGGRDGRSDAKSKRGRSDDTTEDKRDRRGQRATTGSAKPRETPPTGATADEDSFFGKPLPLMYGTGLYGGTDGLEQISEMRKGTKGTES